MQPWCGNGIDLQGCESNGAIHRVEIGRKQRLEDVAQAVIIERGACESRLQQRQHSPLFQPLPHLVEGMMPIQNREDQGFDPAATRELVCRVGRDEAVDHGGDLQAPEYAKSQRQMSYRMNLLYCNGHGAPPVGAFARQHHSPVRFHSIAGSAFRKKSRGSSSPLEPGYLRSRRTGRHSQVPCPFLFGYKEMGKAVEEDMAWWEITLGLVILGIVVRILWWEYKKLF